MTPGARKFSIQFESIPEHSQTRRILSDLSTLEDEPHAGPEHGELWLVSYADLMTLLFGFFVMLYADSAKIQDIQKTFDSPPEALAEKNQTEIESTVLKERIQDLEAKLILAQGELKAQRESVEKRTSLDQPTASWSKKSIQEEARLLFRMPCRFCANFSNSIDTQVAGMLGASTHHVILTHVTKGGPADLAGLHTGDLIESIAGHPPTERGLFESLPVGEEVAVELRRFGKKMVLQVRLDSISPEALEALKTAPIEASIRVGQVDVSRIGPRERIMYYIPSEIEGALVTRSCSTCSWVSDRLEVGDVIVSINGEWISAPDQLSQAWTGPALVEVWRKNTRTYDLVRLSPG